MANYYIFLSNEADILREMGAFIQALKVSCEMGCITHRSNQQQQKRCEINGRENQAMMPFELMFHGLAFLLRTSGKARS